MRRSGEMGVLGGGGSGRWRFWEVRVAGEVRVLGGEGGWGDEGAGEMEDELEQGCKHNLKCKCDICFQRMQ